MDTDERCFMYDRGSPVTHKGVVSYVESVKGRKSTLRISCRSVKGISAVFIIMDSDCFSKGWVLWNSEWEWKHPVAISLSICAAF